MKKKVAIIFTGGTISMKVDKDLKAAIPALNSHELMDMVKNIDEIAEIEEFNFSNIPSPHITPDMMMEISQLINELIGREDIDGLILTHGTDTLEETAYLVDLTNNSSKPIVVVGAMRNSSELGYDGSSNLSAGICTAVSDNAKNKGVLVVMNNMVNAAAEVTKTNTLSLDTFKSPEFGPLGIVDNDEVFFYRDIVKREFIDTNEVENKVGLIKAVAGMDDSIINYYVDSGYKGLVIEALGRGNLPPGMLGGIKKALAKNIPLVIVSRCPTGRVLDTYGYEGGGKHLRDLGAILGGNLPGQKARIKLMLLLSVTKDPERIRSAFEK